MRESDLLSGPRGRRFLLEYARSVDPGDGERLEDSFAAHVGNVGYQLDPTRGVGRKGLSFRDRRETHPVVSVGQLAGKLQTLDLPDVTPERLRNALVAAVDNARYWQEPDGEDVLCTLPDMQPALTRVARHICKSPHTMLWSEPTARSSQWMIYWNDFRFTDNPEVVLSQWREDTITQEALAQPERPAEPVASWSGQWWSIPPYGLLRSSGVLPGGSPSGLWFVEDGFGEVEAMVEQLLVPKDARVLEIGSAGIWADLCARFPLNVTASKRHDWYRTTGRNGLWVIPDWSAVARNFDGVHLTVAAYLAAAGRTIPVGEDAASMIAGWNPGETWWFTRIPRSGHEERWVANWGRNGADWDQVA